MLAIQLKMLMLIVIVIDTDSRIIKQHNFMAIKIILEDLAEKFLATVWLSYFTQLIFTY